ncbi:hypothetical protein LINGRAHAP2_LOCUS7815 [Linum grandiflorum]
MVPHSVVMVVFDLTVTVNKPKKVLTCRRPAAATQGQRRFTNDGSGFFWYNMCR